MARAKKLHCACGTPVMSATDHGLEFRCDCGATMFIPYAQLSGVEHLARFVERQAAAKTGTRSPRRRLSARGQAPRQRRAARRP
jgi:hypothetical protein